MLSLVLSETSSILVSFVIHALRTSNTPHKLDDSHLERSAKSFVNRPLVAAGDSRRRTPLARPLPSIGRFSGTRSRCKAPRRDRRRTAAAPRRVTGSHPQVL